MRRTPLAAAVSSRAVVFFVGYLAVIVFGYAGGRPPVRDFDNELRNLPSRFDARWYLQIATSGYSFDSHAAADVQQNVVFFPAFPMAIRAAAPLFGGGMAGAMAAGTVLSLLAFVVALVYLHRFTEDSRGAPEATIWLLAFYPFAIFYGAIYTESLFLLATVAAVYHAGRGQQARAAAWAAVAGLTRPNGLLLSVLLAGIGLRRSAGQPRARATALGVACAPLLGALAYSAFLWRMTGDPWIWARGHVAWGRTYQGLTALVANRYEMIANGGIARYLADLPHDALNGLGAIFVLATVWPVARMLGIEYAAWMLLTLLPPLAAGGLISAGRFSSVLFPAFVWLGSAVPARQLPGWIGIFAAFEALCATMFYTWRPLY